MFEPGKLQHLISTDRATARKVEAAPYTLESLALWLETMPPNEAYDYHNCAGLCLLSQYATAHGDDGENYYSVARQFMAVTGPVDSLGVCSVATKIAQGKPMVFLAALERTYAAIKARAA